MPYADHPGNKPSLTGSETGAAAMWRSGFAIALTVCWALGVGACSSLSSHAPVSKGEAESKAASKVTTQPEAAPTSASAAPAPSAIVGEPAAHGTDAASAVAPAGPVPAAIDPAVLAQFEAALAELGAGHLDAARSALESLLEAHPDMGGIHANLGIVLRRQEHLDEAVEQLKAAVALDPQQPVFWNQLGITYRQSGHFAEAKDAYEKAIAADPSYGSALLNLAILTDLYLWDGQSALALYEKYQSMQSEPDAKVAKWIADLKNRLKSEARSASAAPAEGGK